MAMENALFKAATITIIAVISTYFLILLNSSRPVDPSSSLLSASSREEDQTKIDNVIPDQIQNGTLGFEKIFVLNMPERSDKRDSISLAAALTGMKLDFIDGIKGQTVLNKTLPFGRENRDMAETTIGSWRAHMNAIRTVVEQDISSALILEDDSDWDIRLKSLLIDFSAGSNYLLNTSSSTSTLPSSSPPNNPTLLSPYGSNWDVLWLGHCHEIFPPDPRIYTLPASPSVPQLSKLPMSNPEILATFPPHTRVVHMTGSPICTFGYAISQRGARKLLYGLSVHELRGIFDNALSWWCSEHTDESVCVSVQPPLFYHHRFRGAKGKSSDINKGGEAREKGETAGIRWSTRLNLGKLVAGKTDFEDTYPDDA